MPRLFTGVEIPADIALELNLMTGGVIGARWIDRDSYHITLRFIGDIDDRLAHEIAYELEGVEARPFELRLKGIDIFGGKKPSTLYVGVEENPGLRRLQAIH
jgi:2'-5' RNA ligase